MPPPLSLPSDCLPHQTSMQAVAQKSVGEAATWQAERRQWEEINRQQEEQLHTLQIERATHQGVEERFREMMGQRDAAEVRTPLIACDCLPHQGQRDGSIRGLIACDCLPHQRDASIRDLQEHAASR